MKKMFVQTAATLLLSATAVAQPLVIKGRVRCMNQSANSSKGAENIIVVPTFTPSKSSMTASEPPGYFELRTGMTLQQLQDKQVNVHLISRCMDCKESVKRVFISEDQDRQNRDNKISYVTVRDWKTGKNCNQFELPQRSADSALQVVMRQPDLSMKEITDATALVGSPALLNFITTLTTVLTPVQNFGASFATKLQPGKINYGNFLFASAMTHTANPGFNFSPVRDMSEAMFWNSAAMVNSRTPNNVSLLTNLKNVGKLGAFFKVTDKITMGGGVIFDRQDEFRNAEFKRDPLDDNEFPFDVDSLTMKLDEYAIFLSPAYKVNNKLSVGLTIKSIGQDFNNPDSLFIDFNGTENTNTFTDTLVKEQNFDVDVSLVYRLSKSFQIGLSAMNLAGTELYADAFVSRQTPLIQNQRSFGLGLCYKWQRLNVGADLLFTEDDFYDATIGVNYVPFNNALITAGVAVRQLSYSVAFRIKHFRIAYIDDNYFLVNEKRKGKASVLNGRLYGGFSFNF